MTKSNQTPFEAYLSGLGRAALTIQGYQADVNRFAAWFELANAIPFNVQAVTTLDIRNYRQHLQMNEHFRPGTINRRLAALAAFLDWATQTGQIGKNPASQIRSVPADVGIAVWLDRKQQHDLRAAIDADLQVAEKRYPRRKLSRQRDAAIALFILNTGLLLSELLEMRLGDIVFGERSSTVVVRQGMERSLPLSAEARRALQDWLAIRPNPQSDFIWTAPDGSNTPLTSRAAQYAIKRIGSQAGIPNLNAQMIRHTYAHNQAERGMAIEKLARLLGHQNITSTRVYFVPNED